MEHCHHNKIGCLIIDIIKIMIQQRLPPQLQYSFIIPKGFPSIYKQWQLDPMSSNKQWANNDIVRFNFMNLGKGVFDPYRSYIQFTVSTNQSSSPVGLLQIDNSGQSFINQMVLYSNGKQIERQNQYGILASYLNDIGLNQLISQGRQAQGFGYGSFDTMPIPRAQSNSAVSTRITVGTPTITSSSGNIFPTIGNYYPQSVQYESQNAITNSAKSSKGHVTNSNVVIAKSDLNGGRLQTSQPCLNASMAISGYANNIRCQYNTKFIQNKFPESTQSIPNYELQLSQSVSQGKYPINYYANTPYQTCVRNVFDDFFVTSNNISTPVQHTINCANFGFNSLFCPFFTRGTFQPCISATVPQVSMFNGKYEQTKVPIYRKRFKVPLISGVIGVLIDPSRFMLIPLTSINTLLLQLTLDPYAMFTSGFCDYSEIDTKGMSIMQNRNYCIERIQYRLQTYHFHQSEMDKYIQLSLVKQITVITNFWSMSNQYQIPGGSGANNSYIVGCNSTHLNQMVGLFVPNDYQTCPYARKHFRISNNVTKCWSKLGVDYWPPQPYKGNGGNVSSNNYQDDNSIFVQNLYWATGYMFAKSPLPRINAYNFAVNQRPYNVLNKNTFYDPDMVGNTNYVFTANSVNADTAMGMSWLHENRVVGKAAYVITYTPFRQSQSVLQGINVSGISNFQLIFESDQSNTFPRDQTLYIFTRSSGVVKYGKQGIETYGRG